MSREPDNHTWEWQDEIAELRAEVERLQASLDACADYGDEQVAEIERLRARVADLEEQLLRALGEKP